MTAGVGVHRWGPPGAAAPDNADALAVAVASALERGRPQLGTALLAGASQSTRGSLQGKQLHAMCQVGVASESGAPAAAFLQLLGLEAASATSTSIRRQFRRLAALVHPDKVGAPLQPAAASAFQQLQRGVTQLLAATEQGDSGDAEVAERPNKRSRGDARLGDEEPEDVWLASDNGGFPWWGCWDQAPGAGQQREAAEDNEQQQQLQIGDDQARLAGLEVAELREEVRRRQAALLDPPPRAGDGTPAPTLPQLRGALGRASTRTR